MCPATNAGSDSRFRPIGRYSHLPEDEVGHVEVSEVTRFLLLNQLLENADIVGHEDLHSEDLC